VAMTAIDTFGSAAECLLVDPTVVFVAELEARGRGSQNRMPINSAYGQQKQDFKGRKFLVCVGKDTHKPTVAPVILRYE